ncbi:hypothetical protein ALE3EI_0433 [Constantimarinum furrinae]|uniref:Uncharacterized protein n=2 Tax=Constantimarinum furrinae TaxID=2562285 RepID=A0A7G8PRQ0_9FLAO|nr:hypothetical protein ALE3EI_0433 [Constantimarinum furrinae]
MERELIQAVKMKALKEGAPDSKNGVAEHVSGRTDISISSKSITNYLKNFGAGNDITIAFEIRDSLARYLGYRNFRDFQNQGTQGSIIKKYLLWFLIIALGVSVSWNFFGTGDECCMLWIEDHWEETDCSGKKLERECEPNTLEKMRLVEVCKNAPFKKDGQQILWYDKTDNVVTFFTYHGLHPVNGKTLKEATEGMVEKYGKVCE